LDQSVYWFEPASDHLLFWIAPPALIYEYSEHEWGVF